MTVDPFYTTSTPDDDVIMTLEQIREYSPENGEKTESALNQIQSTYAPIQSYKTLRILTMHLWVLTSRKSTILKNLSVKGGDTLSAADQIQPELDREEDRLSELRAMPEQTKPVKAEIRRVKSRITSIRNRLRKAERNVKYPVTTPDLHSALENSHCPGLDALCQALTEMDRATTQDVAPFTSKHSATSSPVRAEMVQNLSSAWDMGPTGSSILKENMIMGVSRLDPSNITSSAEHLLLMPLLIPHRNGKEMQDTQAIPLLWTTDMDRDPYGYVKRPGQAKCETMVKGTSNYISVKPRNMDRGDTPQWKYAIVAIPVPKGPIQYDPSSPAIHAFNSKDPNSPFEFSAGLWRLNRITSAAMGIRLPIEDMDYPDGLLWGADLPLIARATGTSAARAVALHDTLHKPLEVGTRTRLWSPLGEPTKEMLASSHAATARHLIGVYNHTAPELGKWGALLSGLRYLPLAWRSGYLSALPGNLTPEVMTMGALNRPTNDLLRQVQKKPRNKKTVVAAYERNNSSRRDITHKVKASERKHKYQSICDLDTIGAQDFLRTSVLSKRDVSSARDMLAPLIAECLCKFISEIDGGAHGPIVRNWMRTAMDTAELDPEGFTYRLTNHMRRRAQVKGNAINYAGDQIKGT